jgi:hypothetical protein
MFFHLNGFGTFRNRVLMRNMARDWEVGEKYLRRGQIRVSNRHKEVIYLTAKLFGHHCVE